MRDDLDDPLQELFTAAAANPTSAPKKSPPASYQHTESCPKCHGKGQIYSYASGRPLGPCFKCKGKGAQTFKTAPAARQQAATRRRTKLEEQTQAWITEHPAEHKWLLETSRRILERGGDWAFPAEIYAKLRQYGSLTDGQLAAVQKYVARDGERQVANVARAEQAPEIAVLKIEEAFAKAAKSLRAPKLHLDSFTIKHASASGKNPGALYVTDATKTDAEGKAEYLGKIVGGKFLAVRSCGAERQAAVVAAAADPQAATIRYGRLTGCCGCCGRKLENAESVARGIGPICAEKYGW